MPRLKTRIETAPKITPTPARTNLLPLAGLLIVTLLTFASTFTFGWVYDDPPQIPQNQNLEWNRIGFLFTHQLWASLAGMQGRFYRPLLTLWLLINKTLFGLNPHAFHVTTVLAHLTAVALAFFIARNLLKDFSAALFATAIFALHPLQVESASWISSVNDPLAASLCFASFLSYRRANSDSRASSRWWGLAGFFFLLALFCKEVSIVLPGIILVDLLLTSGSSSRDRQKANSRERQKDSPARSPLIPISIYALVASLWLALRSWVLAGATASRSSLSLSDSVLNAPRILLFNLYRVFVPVGLSPQYDFHLVESAATAQFIGPLLAISALASLAILTLRRARQLSVAFAWLILPLLPTLNLQWMNQDDFIHDRYMYMSMLGVALLAGFGFEWARRKWPKQQLLRPLALCIALILAFLSAIQSQYWANDLILFSRAVSRAPDNEWAQLNYGSALSARGKFAEAAPHFVKSYKLQPGWRAADFAAFSYQQSGDLSAAEQWFKAALQFDPTLASAWFGLGQIKLAQHLPEEAIPNLKKALALDPGADGFHYEMGAGLEQISQPSAAIKEYEEELRLHPYQTGARKALDRLQSATASGR